MESVSALQNYATTNSAYPVLEKGSTGALNQDDFFKLLTVQLTSQDPLKPMEDTEFIAQMTSFSSLSEMENMAADMKTMREQQEAYTKQALLGKRVLAQDSYGGTLEGVITRVARQDGELIPYIGDLMVDPEKILE
ncbi:MAG: hypothetical protein KJT03_21615, partial [Verrucomicrobiae bacterium]|nr:hypothetical protein [Verrucomicrobiae bacterium]